VIEFIDIASKDIEKAPAFGVKIDIEYIQGMTKVKGKLITFLNIS
jgi:chemotaxis signal transduction protein